MAYVTLDTIGGSAGRQAVWAANSNLGIYKLVQEIETALYQINSNLIRSILVGKTQQPIRSQLNNNNNIAAIRNHRSNFCYFGKQLGKFAFAK